MLTPLPIDPSITGIVQLVRERRAAVVIAAPGAGKTTGVPAALAGDGPVLLLQPRRVVIDEFHERTVHADLGLLWATGYAEVRTQLRARYPKHAWPETPR